MSENKIPSEALRLPSVSDINQLFSAVDRFNDDNSGNILADALRSAASNKGTQADIDALIDQGLTYETSVSVVSGLHEVSSSDRTFEATLVGLGYSNTMQACGLAPNAHDTEGFMKLRMFNGEAFAGVLSSLEPSETERPELAEHLTLFFSDYIHELQHTTKTAYGTRMVRIFGEQGLPDWWIGTDWDLETPLETNLSLSQFLEYAPVFADQLERIVGENPLALTLRTLAAYNNDDDIVVWAAASEFGFFPETAADQDIMSHNNVWPSWMKSEEWQPALSVLYAANPAGRFRVDYVSQMRKAITKAKSRELAFVATDYAAYTASHEAHADIIPDDDFEPNDVLPSKEQYEQSVTIAHQYIAELEAVEAQLTLIA